MNNNEMKNANGGILGSMALGAGLGGFLCWSMKKLYEIAMKSLKR